MDFIIILLVIVWVFFGMIANAKTGQDIDRTVPNPPDPFDGFDDYDGV